MLTNTTDGNIQNNCQNSNDNRFLADQLYNAGRISHADKSNLLVDSDFMARNPSENVNLFCKAGKISEAEKPLFSTWEAKQESVVIVKPDFSFKGKLPSVDKLVQDPRYTMAMTA